MSLPNRVLVTLACLAVPALAVPASALFHTRLEKSTPAKDAALAAAPTEIRLWFNERVEAKLSTISVVGSDSSKVALGAVKATDDPMSIAAPVTGAMTPGTWIVRWRTAGKDGHAVRGSFSFSIAR